MGRVMEGLAHRDPSDVILMSNGIRRSDSVSKRLGKDKSVIVICLTRLQPFDNLCLIEIKDIMETKFKIRKATPEDIRQIAEVNITSWKETYPGIMPEERMARLNLDSCIQNWESTFAQDITIFVATLDNEVVGFVSGGKNRQQEGCKTGLANDCECELAAMYLVRKHQKHGIGKIMFECFVSDMQKRQYHTMTLWVAAKNPATGFYERMGGELIDHKDLIICGQAVPVLAYKYNI
jgi:GNAT superfamily N-acetyltransferase